MPVAEKRALTEIVLWSVAFAYVWIRFTAGWELAGQSFGLQLVEQGPRQVFATYLGIGLFAAAVQIGVYGLLRARGRVMPLDLATPTGVVFALLATLLLQEIVRNATRLVLHKRA